MVRKRWFEIVLLTMAALAVSLPSADAYVDPGSGSYIIQVVVGGLLGAAFAVKVFWRRVRGYLGAILRRGS